MTHIKKVLRPDNYTLVFIFKTNENSGFYWWEVQAGVVADWFLKHRNPMGSLRALSGNLTPELAEQFGNDPCNADIGTSSGEYDTIEEILKEYDFLK